MDQCLDGNWHMITVTYDGAVLRRYVDAVDYVDTTVTASTGLRSLPQLRIARNGPNATYSCMEASLSDVRIYTTALSAAAIAELYNIGMTIDKKGNIHINEIIEAPSLQFTKTATLRGYFEEGANTAGIPTHFPRYQAAEFIER